MGEWGGVGVARRLWLTAFAGAVGIAEIAFAIQIRTWHGRAVDSRPANKVFIASWPNRNVDQSVAAAGRRYDRSSRRGDLLHVSPVGRT